MFPTKRFDTIPPDDVDSRNVVTWMRSDFFCLRTVVIRRFVLTDQKCFPDIMASSAGPDASVT